MKKPFLPRSGMAIVVALAFAVGLFIMTGGMWMAQKNVAGGNRLTLQKQQAHFAARAAMQHFLIKAKYLPTELYDAVAFTSGKNPMFSFTEYLQGTGSGDKVFLAAKDDRGDAVKHGGKDLFALFRDGELVEPDRKKRARYLYMPVPDKTDVYFRVGSYYNPGYRFLNQSLVDTTSTKYQKANPSALGGIPEEDRIKFIDYFLSDCSTCATMAICVSDWIEDNKSSKRYDIVSDLGAFDYSSDLAKQKRYPYTMNYRVVSVEIAAMKELRKYGEEAIKVVVEGKIKDHQQNKEYISRQERTQKITRTGSI